MPNSRFGKEISVGILISLILIVGLFVSVVPAASSTKTTISLDGSGASSCPNYTVSCSATFSTQNKNDVIIVFAVEELNLQSSSCAFNVSDSSGLNWASRSSVLFDSTGRTQMQEFWAKATNSLSTDSVTESINGCGDNYNSLMVFGINGANVFSPFDPNTVLPATAGGLSGATSVSVSTSNPNDMIFGAVVHGNICCFPTAGPGFTMITSPDTHAAEYAITNATVTNLAVMFADTATDSWISMADAVQAMPTTPDFAISANPAVLTISQPNSVSSTVTLVSLNGFSGTVNLSLSSLPSGFTDSILPTIVTLSPNGTAQAMLTLNSFSNNATTFNLIVDAISGQLTHSFPLKVNANLQLLGHDFSINAYPTSFTLLAGSSASSDLQVYQQGPSASSFTVSLLAQVPSIGGLTATVVPSSVTITASPYSSGASATLNIGTLSSTPPGNYTVTVLGVSGTFSHSTAIALQVLPPPSLALTPSNGPLGTKVVVFGTGFPAPYGSTEILMTFDDQLLGFAFTSTGSFNFTFNVPVSQPGSHLVKATEPSFTSNSITTTVAQFQVVGSPVPPSVSLTVGTVYFPGDSAVVSILVTANGVPLSSSSLQLTLSLTRPNSAPIILTTKSLGSGLFRASYSVPKSATIGTYTLEATAHMPGSGDGSGLGSFEVRLPWLSSGAQTAAATIGIASVAFVGLAVVSWRQGYFKRSSKDKY